MRATRYFLKLVGEFLSFALEHKAWWILPVIIVIVLVGLLMTTSGTVLPYVYTLF